MADTARRPVDLDRRRGWARVRAAAACLVGTAVFGLSIAGLVLLGFVAVARFWSFWSSYDFDDVPVWRLAPGGMAWGGGVVAAVCLAAVFFYFWRGAGRQVLAEVGAEPARQASHRVVLNVVEELSIGIGRTPPEVYVVPDEVPNALSVRDGNARALVVTSGVIRLPRDQVEAICAHEIGHLWAADSHWVTAGMVVLARARRFAGVIGWLGALVLVVVSMIAYYLEVLLWSTGLIALAMLGLAAASHFSLRRLELRVRREADAIADVVAVRLARNPASLAAACRALGDNPHRVSRVGWRSELMWFEAVEDPGAAQSVLGGQDPADEALTERLAAAARRELADRARHAYAAAGLPEPDLG